jgi:hypothetical protein
MGRDDVGEISCFEFQTSVRDLAARSARSFARTLSLEKRGSRECRVHAAPAVSCASCTKKCAHEHTGSAEAIRHSPRNGFTAYAVLSPATNSSCHRRCRLDGYSIRLDRDRHRQLGTSNGCRDHMVLPYATTRLRQEASPGFDAVRPAHCRPLTETALRTTLRADAAASTASHPAFVTIAIRPSCRERTGRAGSADLPDGESEIFFSKGLDRFLLICPSGWFAAATAPQDGQGRACAVPKPDIRHFRDYLLTGHAVEMLNFTRLTRLAPDYSARLRDTEVPLTRQSFGLSYRLMAR